MYTHLQELILFLLVAIIALTSYIVSGSKRETPLLFSLNHEHFRININTAEWRELDLLPGLGPARAKEIVNYRAKAGRFNKFEDLLYIKGINEQIINKIQKTASLN